MILKLPLTPESLAVVIDPKTIRYLKSGQPLMLELDNGSSVLISYTPDMKRLQELLGTKVQAGMEAKIKLSPEQLDAALKVCKDLPESDSK